MKITKTNLSIAIALLVFGPSIFLLMPVYIGAVADAYGYSASRLGLLASSDLIGIFVACASAPLWINRVRWRLLMPLFWCAVIAGNWLSLSVNDYGWLFLLRLMTGLVTGGVLAVGNACLSFTSNPDRIYAIATFMVVGYQAVSFAILPSVIADYSLEGLFLYILAPQLLILPALYLVPQNSRAECGDAIENVEGAESHRDSYIVLGAMALFFICQTGVFSFVDLVGNANGLSDTDVGIALSLSTALALAGPLVAVALGGRLNRFRAILFAGCGQLAVLFAFDFVAGLVAYTAMLTLFQLFWTFSLGYQFGTLAATDKGHRFTAMVPAAQAGGIALGPILAGNAMELGGHMTMYIVCGTAIVLYLMLILPRAKVSAGASQPG